MFLLSYILRFNFKLSGHHRSKDILHLGASNESHYSTDGHYSAKGNQCEGWGGKLHVVTNAATSCTYLWGGKLCLPQRAQLASEGSSAASAKQELGSPFPTRIERKPFLLATH